MFRLPLLLIAIVAISLSDAQLPAQNQDQAAQKEHGKEIYRAQCASCHGEQGQGVEGRYSERLEGDLTLDALSEVIEGTMPDQDPDLCVAEDADAVARYIFSEFYGGAARAKKVASIELTHLTNAQHKNSIADLAARFSGRAWLDENMTARGFKGRYFSSRHFDHTKSIGERTDAKIDFDFGNGSPFAPQVAMEELGIQWFATLQVEETGLYDFYVEPPNGFRLFINDSQIPVIDAWVSTGDDGQEASIYLLGGHSYLVKLDMFKFQEETAKILFKWRPPFGKIESIPTEKLRPVWAPKVLVSSTVLPPDDSSVGFARGTSVSRAWLEGTSESALEVANTMLSDPEKFMGVKRQTSDKEKKYKEFCQKLASFAFCRPLSEEQVELYIDSQFVDAESLEAATKRSILLILQSPRFLYPELGSEPTDSFTVASRLSMTIWDSIPDQELWSAANGGNLVHAEAVRFQAERMLKDPLARTKIREFFHHWLEMNADDLTKDPELYPDFDMALAADLRKSLGLFLDDVVWSEESDYRRLYSSNELYASQQMAEYYKLEPKPEAPQFSPPSIGDGQNESLVTATARAKIEGFEKLEAKSEMRFGILTHPYLMTELSYHRTTSPIHRGVFVARRLIGRALKQPPENFEPLKEDFDPTMTTRERVAHQTKDNSCQTCHSFINPLGFSLEGFDAVGNLRETEKGKPVDTSSNYKTEADVEFTIDGPRELANYLVDSEKARRTFVKRLFQHLVKHSPEAYGSDTLDLLDKSFVQNQYSIKKLIVSIVELVALHGTDAASKIEIFKFREPKSGAMEVPTEIQSKLP